MDNGRTVGAAAKVLVITEGARGCTVFVRGQRARYVPAPLVTEVDPTGAGDVFAAAFFIRLRETQSPYRAAQFANGIAANSVTRAGLAGVPSQAEARRYREEFEVAGAPWDCRSVLHIPDIPSHGPHLRSR